MATLNSKIIASGRMSQKFSEQRDCNWSADLIDFTDTKYQDWRWLDRNRLGRENA
jgi:hypothetical protein